jgi:ATP-binding cassette subfamily B protein
MKRRFLIPEVIQLSAMDCGPASLKCLLDGFRIPTSYDALRESCRTDVDGTSIDELGRVARAAGLDATQVMIPPDHVLLAEARALPALAVFRHPNGNTHFSVIWSMHGDFVQMMDPAAGRVWRRREEVLAHLYRHTATIPVSAWTKWASSESFLRVLRRRMRDVGVDPNATAALIVRALSSDDWKPIATLDAGTRTLRALRESVGRIPNAAALLGRYLDDESAADQIPENFWTVRPAADGKLSLRGAVMLHAKGVKEEAGGSRAEGRAKELRSPKQQGPLRALFAALRSDGALNQATLIGIWLANAAVLIIQALLLRAVFGVATKLTGRAQLIAGMTALLVLLFVLFIERLVSALAIYRYARIIESHFRRLVLRKIPRLGDRYFQTRLPADVAERSHSIVQVRLAPFMASRVVSSFFELVLTAAGIVWIDPAVWPYALATAIVALGAPLLTHPVLAGHELRVRVHTAGLGRFYLDTLLGASAIRAHAAERSVRREQQSLLAEWARASLRLVRLGVSAAAVQMAVTTALVALLLFDFIRRHGDAGGALLLVYWALNLPFLGNFFAQAIQQYQPRSNAALRVLELLDGPEQEVCATPSLPPSSGAASIDLDAVTVRLTSRVVLDRVSLRVAPGEHVAIVGASGAGKSTLVGLLLGWSSPASGTVSVDGRPLDAAGLDVLRCATAWVDPAIQIWNRSLLDNLTYGSEGFDTGGFSAAMAEADLVELLHSLPQGLQTPLGEGGGLVSGGEGQRVRLGRAMCRTDARLVILDEPFRGLDREKRAELLARARRLWANATLLCVTHDIPETRDFDGVVVVDGGRIVEQGKPSELLSNETSHYAALLRAAASARESWWGAGWWRQVRVEGGELVERG